MRAFNPAYINSLPWIQRKRVTYEELCEIAQEKGLPEPSHEDWSDTIRLTDKELELLNEVIEDMRVTPDGLRALDHYFFVRKFGNKPRVCWREPDGSLGQMSPGDFRNAHIEKLIEFGTKQDGSPKYRKLVDVWLEDDRTLRYDRVEFLPGKRHWEVDANVYNLWAG